MKFKNRSQKRKGKTIENRNKNYQQNQMWFQITIFNRHFNRKSFTRMTIINRSLKHKCKIIENRYLNYVH